MYWKTEAWERGRYALSQKYQRSEPEISEVNIKVCDLVCIEEPKLTFERGVLADNIEQETEGFERKDLERGAKSS